jgi:hypothetical protein
VPEMDWVLGLLLFYADRYDQAIPHLRRLAGPAQQQQQQQQQHRADAIPLLALALIRTNRIDEAAPVCRKALTEVPGSPLLASIRLEFRARAEQMSRRSRAEVP